MRPWLLLTPLVLLLVPPRVHAQGAPPEAAVAGYLAFTSGLFGVTWSPAQEAEIRRQVAVYWAEGRTAQQQTVHESARLWARALASEPDVRATAFAMSRPQVLQQMRAAAQAGDADARWFVDAYYAANPPLAPGAPDGLPLVREVVDAWLDLDWFMRTQIHRQPVPPLTRAAREAAYRDAAARYAALPAAEQLALAAKPGELATTLGQWRRMNPVMQAMVRQAQGGPLTPEEQAAIQQALGTGPNGAQAQMLAGTLQHMRETSDIIMGRGTTWNATLGRWEQQGGIVTEYNGTVRVP